MKDPEARKQLVFAIQRYAAEQQYYVYLSQSSRPPGSRM